MAYDQDLAVRLRGLLSGLPGLSEKKMFGGIGYMLDGNMVCGIQGEGLIVRLGEKEYELARSRPNTRPFGVPGKRPMTGWLIVDPPGWRAEEDLHRWVENSLAYTRTLPSKSG